MTTQTHQPWKPTCWVGGMYLGPQFQEPWVCMPDIQLAPMRDGSEAKYAATKATAAILRSMRK